MTGLPSLASLGHNALSGFEIRTPMTTGLFEFGEGVRPELLSWMVAVLSALRPFLLVEMKGRGSGPSHCAMKRSIDPCGAMCRRLGAHRHRDA